MPLSENEQRMLEQMERALYAEDPKFATQLKGSDARTFYRKRLVVAGIGFSLGIVVLMAGAITAGSNTTLLIVLALVGFALMLASAWIGITSWRKIPAPGEIGTFPTGGSSPRGKSSSPRFMNRVEDRWKKRRDDMGR
ncbi:MAG: DUF3040 domain-containing protein [Jiangellales bacterium]